MKIVTTARISSIELHIDIVLQRLQHSLQKFVIVVKSFIAPGNYQTQGLQMIGGHFSHTQSLI